MVNNLFDVRNKFAINICKGHNRHTHELIFTCDVYKLF